MPDEIRIGASVDIANLRAGMQELVEAARTQLEKLKADYAAAQVAIKNSTAAMAAAQEQLTAQKTRIGDGPITPEAEAILRAYQEEINRFASEQQAAQSSSVKLASEQNNLTAQIALLESQLKSVAAAEEITTRQTTTLDAITKEMATNVGTNANAMQALYVRALAEMRLAAAGLAAAQKSLGPAAAEGVGGAVAALSLLEDAYIAASEVASNLKLQIASVTEAEEAAAAVTNNAAAGTQAFAAAQGLAATQLKAVANAQEIATRQATTLAAIQKEIAASVGASSSEMQALYVRALTEMRIASNALATAQRELGPSAAAGIQPAIDALSSLEDSYVAAAAVANELQAQIQAISDVESAEAEASTVATAGATALAEAEAVAARSTAALGAIQEEVRANIGLSAAQLQSIYIRAATEARIATSALASAQKSLGASATAGNTEAAAAIRTLETNQRIAANTATELHARVVLLTNAESRATVETLAEARAEVEARIARLGAATAALAEARALGELSAAHHSNLTEIGATSGAIRAAFGESSIRAVERFLATTLGLGSVFKAIFPVVGAIALLEMFDHIRNKVGDIMDAMAGWDSINKELFSVLLSDLDKAAERYLTIQKEIDSFSVIGKSGFLKIQEETRNTAKEQQRLQAEIKSTERTLDDLVGKARDLKVGFNIGTLQEIEAPITTGLHAIGVESRGYSENLRRATESSDEYKKKISETEKQLLDLQNQLNRINLTTGPKVAAEKAEEGLRRYFETQQKLLEQEKQRSIIQTQITEQTAKQQYAAGVIPIDEETKQLEKAEQQRYEIERSYAEKTNALRKREEAVTGKFAGVPVDVVALELQHQEKIQSIHAESTRVVIKEAEDRALAAAEAAKKVADAEIAQADQGAKRRQELGKIEVEELTKIQLDAETKRNIKERELLDAQLRVAQDKGEQGLAQVTKIQGELQTEEINHQTKIAEITLSGELKKQKELIENAEKRLEALKRDHSVTVNEEATFWKQILSELEKDSKAYDAALKKFTEADVKRRDELRKIQDAQLKDMEAAQKAQLELQIEAAKAASETGVNVGGGKAPTPQVSAGPVLATLGASASQEVALARLVMQLHQQEYENTINTLNAEEAAYVKTLSKEEQEHLSSNLRYIELENQKHRATEVFNRQQLADQISLIKALTAQWDAFFQTFNQGFSRAINNAITHQKTFGQSMKELYNQLVQQEIDFVATWLLKEAERWLKAKILGLLHITVDKGIQSQRVLDAEAANTAIAVSDGALAGKEIIANGLIQNSWRGVVAAEAEAAGIIDQMIGSTFAKLAATIAANEATAESYIGLASAEEFEYVISTTGNIFAAVAAAAATYGAGEPFAGLAGFETGGVIPNTGIALVHQGEAVLPQSLTALLNKAASNTTNFYSDNQAATTNIYSDVVYNTHNENNVDNSAVIKSQYEAASSIVETIGPKVSSLSLASTSPNITVEVPPAPSVNVEVPPTPTASVESIAGWYPNARDRLIHESEVSNIGLPAAPVAPPAPVAVVPPASIASFETGGIIPNTGVALVHQGEGVLPAPLTSFLKNTANVSFEHSCAIPSVSSESAYPKLEAPSVSPISFEHTCATPQLVEVQKEAQVSSQFVSKRQLEVQKEAQAGPQFISTALTEAKSSWENVLGLKLLTPKIEVVPVTKGQENVVATAHPTENKIELVDKHTNTDLSTVLKHEIGHLLGVPHIAGDNLMNAVYGGAVSVPTEQSVKSAKEAGVQYALPPIVAPSPTMPSVPAPKTITVPAFETGGIVPKTGIALVHKGEGVLPQPLTSFLNKAALTTNFYSEHAAMNAYSDVYNAAPALSREIPALHPEHMLAVADAVEAARGGGDTTHYHNDNSIKYAPTINGGASHDLKNELRKHAEEIRAISRQSVSRFNSRGF